MGIDVALNDIKRLTPRYNVRGDPFPSVPALHCLILVWNPSDGSPKLCLSTPEHPQQHWHLAGAMGAGRDWDRQESRDQSCVML